MAAPAASAVEAQLAAMGFAEDAIALAIAVAGDDVDAAIEECLRVEPVWPPRSATPAAITAAAIAPLPPSRYRPALVHGSSLEMHDLWSAPMTAEAIPAEYREAAAAICIVDALMTSRCARAAERGSWPAAATSA